MKTKLILIIMFLLWNATITYSQETDCKVLLPELVGVYNGKCKKGLANGKGIAVGIDKYDGRFKNGLPDGYGIYTSENGDRYEGYFKKGQKHGEGKFKFKINGRDSIFIGIWKNGNLDKKVIPPKYQIIRSLNVIRYTAQKVGATNRVVFSFLQNGTTNNNISNLQLISDTGTPISLGAKQGFENVAFPILCKVSYTTPNPMKTAFYDVSFEIIINDPGEWVIVLNN